MMYPSLFNDNVFDDLFDFSFPQFRGFDDIDRKLYGKNAPHLMKTDIHEFDDRYELDIDLPGFKKDQITLSLEKGNLTIHVAKGLNEEEKNDAGKLIRQERYAGSMQRSFFVGKHLTDEDIKAKFEDGVLKLSLAKKEVQKLPEKKNIMIEG
ncbi:MAG: Hsp20/alpha crystallin family protein [Mogibacterium sp.]|nr:Hsp20/alpha crystallin family protein [Mogibacterium sp.]